MLTNSNQSKQWSNVNQIFVFLDVSGLGRRSPLLRRARWSIVQTDAYGDLVAAAYGAVPWDEAAGQVARDGEDFAVAIRAEVAIELFEVHIYCQGALDAARAPPASTTKGSAGDMGPEPVGQKPKPRWSQAWA